MIRDEIVTAHPACPVPAITLLLFNSLYFISIMRSSFDYWVKSSLDLVLSSPSPSPRPASRIDRRRGREPRLRIIIARLTFAAEASQEGERSARSSNSLLDEKSPPPRARVHLDSIRQRDCARAIFQRYSIVLGPEHGI